MKSMWESCYRNIDKGHQKFFKHYNMPISKKEGDGWLKSQHAK